jgi:signal transduction histidine kinase
VHSELRQRGIKVSFQPGRSMPPVRMDPDRVHEMALNLMLNALDALAERARGGRVKVETWLQLSRQSVGLSVQDNGPGIPPELVKGIFVPFKSGKTRFGTGLGMTIAKQIVDQHGGSIEVDTAAGKGTTFTVYLPILGPAHPSS